MVEEIKINADLINFSVGFIFNIIIMSWLLTAPTALNSSLSKL